jgi:hypothetical protein
MTGARSVSDLTRDAMRVLLNGANREDMLGVTWTSFALKLGALDKKIEQLAAEIATFKADSNH